MMAYYRHAKKQFEQALDDSIVGPRTWPIPREESYPDPVEHCAVCRWYPIQLPRGLADGTTPFPSLRVSAAGSASC